MPRYFQPPVFSWVYAQINPCMMYVLSWSQFVFFVAAFVRDEELGSEEEDLSDEEEQEEEQEKDDDKQQSEVNVNTNENKWENDSEDDDYEDDSEMSDGEEELKNHEPQNDSVAELNMEDDNKKQKLLDKYKNLPGNKRLNKC